MPTELVELPSGSFRMGSTSFYPEEAPIHTVSVGAFAVGQHPVTNAQFVACSESAGYVTAADRPRGPVCYPRAEMTELQAGAMVFRPTTGPVDLRDWRQ